MAQDETDRERQHREMWTQFAPATEMPAPHVNRYREAGEDLLGAVAAFLERGNPTDKAGDREQLKAAYFKAMQTFIPTDNA